MGGVVSAHRLVQAITLAQLPKPTAITWQQAAAVLISAALPDDPKQPANWPVYANLLPHTQAALPLSSYALYRVASYLGHSGGYAAARELFRQILAADQQELGAEHTITLTTRAHLAYWSGRAGDAGSARDQYAELLPARERVSGAEHPSTLTVRANLARWTGRAGDPAGARDQYAELLPVRQRVSGPEHPDTLTSRADLAYWTGQAGDPASARDQYAEHPNSRGGSRLRR